LQIYVKEEVRLNIVLLIGRLTHNVELKEVGNGFSKATILLSVQREFKNSNGEYDTDLIPITLWEGIALSCKEFCKKDSLVSIRCRVQANKFESEDGKTYHNIELIGEKVLKIG